MSGVDAATAPTVAQALAARDAGYAWVGWYCGGPGAYHNWTPAEVEVLRATGFVLSLPIWVPRIVAGRIDPSADPETDANYAAYICGHAYGWQGVIALDTEESMRGDPFTAEYTARWCAQVERVPWQPVVYAGGFTFGDPPPAGFPWWIIPGGGHAPPGTAWQVGQDTIAGWHVDTDSIGSGFPLATLVP
jgi:hypothetical protein